MPKAHVSAVAGAAGGDPSCGAAALPQIGDVVLGTVQSVKPYGAFVDIGNGINGLLHISQISEEHVNNVDEVLSAGDQLKVRPAPPLLGLLRCRGSLGWTRQLRVSPSLARSRGACTTGSGQRQRRATAVQLWWPPAATGRR